MTAEAAKARPVLQEVGRGQELMVDPLLTAGDLLGLGPPPPFIDQVLAQGHVAAVVGQRAVGKTHLLLDMAAAVLEGRHWLGAECKPGAVVFVELDSPIRSLVPRLLANQILLTNPGLRFVRALRNGFVESAADLLTRIRDFEDHLGEHVRLVIIDSLTVTLPVSDSNLGGLGDARRWLDAARLLTEDSGRAVIAAGHPPKGRVGNELFGSMGLGAGLDAILSLSETDGSAIKRDGFSLPDGLDKDARILRVSTQDDHGGKARDYPSMSAYYRRIKGPHGLQTEILAGWAEAQDNGEPKKRMAPAGNAQRLLLDVAKALAPKAAARRAGHPEWPLVGRDGLYKAWTEACKAAGVKRSYRSDFDQAAERLVQAGWLGSEGDAFFIA